MLSRLAGMASDLALALAWGKALAIASGQQKVMQLVAPRGLGKVMQ
jgi:hypothetical protein